jgi:3',5'-cyclic AMP phosphodiesterase CpdA
MKTPLLLVFFAFCLSSQASADESKPIYFAQLTDTHLGVIDHEKVLAQMVDAINTLPFPLACVVVTGDLAMDNFDKPAVREAATSLLGRIRVPVHVLPGNHDLNAKSSAATVTNWIRLFGPLGASADYGGVRFVFVYTEDLFKKGATADFDPFDFLGAELKKAGGQPVLLFQHSPWFEDYYGNAVHPGWPEGARARWAGLVRSGPVKAVIAGHYHRDELYWEGAVPVYVGEAVARFWGRQPAFRIYCWRDGRLSYRTWYLNDAPSAAKKK